MMMWLSWLIACGSLSPTESAEVPPAVTAEAATVDAEGEAPPAVRFEAEPILERPVVLGAISRDAIREVVESRTDAVRACHAAEAPEQPLVGKVLVRFVIGADGAVTKAKVHSTSLRRPDLESCLVSAVRETRFPALSEGGIVVVNWPFAFPLP